jgi:hypothetical protein
MILKKKKYTQLFKDVEKHLNSQGIECELEFGNKVSKKQLDDFCENIDLPDDLREFYLEIGDGIELTYTTQFDGEEEYRSFWMFNLEYIEMNYEPSREALEEQLGWDISAKEKDNLNIAVNWIPFIDDVDASFICIDQKTNQIVFYRVYKDWSKPIVILAKDLYEFLHDWSLYCFSDPYAKNTKSFEAFNDFIDSNYDNKEKIFTWDPELFHQKLIRTKQNKKINLIWYFRFAPKPYRLSKTFY